VISFLSATRWLAFILIVAAAALVLRRVVPYLPSRRARRLVDRWLVPPLELCAAAIAAGWVLSRMIDGQTGWATVTWGLLFLAIAWTARSALEDFVAGGLLRMEGEVDRGRRLAAAGLAGRISQLGYRSIAVETDDGSTVRLPWRTLAREPIRLGETGATVRAFTFTLRVPRTRPIERVLEDIPAAALVSPWASTTRLTDVQLRDETEQSYVLEITVHALDPRFAPQIEAAIRDRLGVGTSA
jgi:small-conductance mechanosensitive channel